jgi:hypothetical protein
MGRLSPEEPQVKTSSRRATVGRSKRPKRLARASAAAAVFLAALHGSSPRPAPETGGSPEMGREPRILLLALDAMPFRVVEEACRRGAFAGWASPSALVAPFPSMTHVSFASLFLPFGVAPSSGYEIHHFDTTANEMVGGSPLTYDENVPSWSEMFDAPGRGLMSKISAYAAPWHSARKDLADIERELLESPRDVVAGYVGATDGILHLQGEESAVKFLLELDVALRDLAVRHLEARGRPLRFVLFSDHGCGSCKLHSARGFERLLGEAGLSVSERLDGPEDVVAPTFGLVNYGVLFLRKPDRAAVAAHALIRHEAVELAAWSPAPNVVEVVSAAGHARILWRDEAGAARYAYEEGNGDPLRLAGARGRLAAAGLLDADGFAHEDDWLRETAFADYPDPLRRRADALAGDRVRSRATVLFSLGPCWSWGWKSALAGAWIRGGRLEGTHGGLDRDSSLGFLLVSDPASAPPRVVRAGTALAPFAGAFLAGRKRDAAGDPRPDEAGTVTGPARETAAPEERRP